MRSERLELPAVSVVNGFSPSEGVLKVASEYPRNSLEMASK
jgi:hypothetical protein